METICERITINASETQKVTVSVKDWLGNGTTKTGFINCDENDKRVLIEQIRKILEEENIINLDIADLMVVFDNGCIYATESFEKKGLFPDDVKNWVRNLEITTGKNIVMWCDGDIALGEYSEILNDLFGADINQCTIIFGLSGKNSEDDKIRFSLWYN